MSQSNGRKRLALVIGSGGVKCAAALGVREAVEAEGFEVDVVVGCSGGAIFAAATALGWSTERCTEVTMNLWTRETTSTPRRRAWLEAAFPRLFGFGPEFGLRDDRLLRKRVFDAFGTQTFADTRLPLYITATDFLSGEQVTLDEGRLTDAIRASLAIPFVFAPWRVGDRLLMDGFLSDPLPVNVAMREGADVILALGFESPMMRRITSPGRVALQLTGVMSNNLLRSRFAFHNLSHHSEVVPIIPEFAERVSIFDTDKIPYVIEEGRRAAEVHLPHLRSLLTTPAARA